MVSSSGSVGAAATVINLLTDVDPQMFEDLCEDLSRRHQVVRRVDTQYFPDGATSERYEFVHALYRQVLYDRLTPRRRARLHQRIGERLEALHPELTDEVVPELAHHFEAAADWPRAVEYLRLEADIARRRFAHSQSDALLQRALELASRLPAAQRAPKELERVSATLAAQQVVSG